jgi:hypothetical protein
MIIRCTNQYLPPFGTLANDESKALLVLSKHECKSKFKFINITDSQRNAFATKFSTLLMRNANCNCKSKEQRGGKEGKEEEKYRRQDETQNKNNDLNKKKKSNFKREVGEICRKKAMGKHEKNS